MQSLFVILITLISQFSSSNSQSLFYLHRKSTLVEKAPVLVFLHGYGSNEADLFQFAEHIPASYHVVSIRAPYQLQESSYAWYELKFEQGKPIINEVQSLQSRLLLIDFLKKLPALIHADASRIYLCGFSQGAIMSYSVSLSRPDLINGISAMSGRILMEHQTFFAPEAQMKNLRVLITHGKNDQVLPFHYAMQADSLLKAKGLKPVLKSYAEGHQISPEMFKDFLNWLD